MTLLMEFISESPNQSGLSLNSEVYVRIKECNWLKIYSGHKVLCTSVGR